MTLTQKRAQASFKTRLLFHLAERKRRKGTEGFTLVELMIVVAVIGLLSAVALPQYLSARNAAAAGSQIGQAIGLAKECATFVLSGIGSAPNASCASNGGTFSGTWGGSVAGLNCLNLTNASGSAVTVSVSSTGTLSCAMS